MAPYGLPRVADESHVHQRGGGLKGGEHGVHVGLV